MASAHSLYRPKRAGAAASRLSPRLDLLSFARSRFGARADLIALTLVAAVMRFAKLGELGYESDEGFTLAYSRLPWRDVIGLDGFYSPHPTLFFTLVKAANLALPEILAARAVAAVAGTLAIPVYYALVARLLDRRVALAASVLVLVAPLHVQYSRIGRMYTPVVALVLLSYLALITYRQDGRHRWAIIYGISLASAVYMDYSAAFALVPQGAMLFELARRDLGRARGLLLAACLAFVAYLPWLPQVVNTIERTSGVSGREEQLSASWPRVALAIRQLSGLGGRSSTERAPYLSLWDRLPDLHWLLFAILIVPALCGIVSLRRRPLALLVALLLCAGTLLTAILTSLLSPSFAARTVMIAIFGWAILASAFLLRAGVPKPIRVVGAIGWLFLFVSSAMALPATYDDGKHGDWPEIADDLASYAYRGWPIAIFSTAGIITDVIDLYAGDELAGTRIITLLDGERETRTGAERFLPRGITLAEMAEGKLAEALQGSDAANEAVWVIRRFGGSAVDLFLLELGYRQIGEFRYFNSTLELWALPGSALGSPVGLDTTFSNERGWRLSRAPIVIDSRNGTTLELVGERSRAVATLPAERGLYTISVEVWTSGQGPGLAIGRVTLNCIAGDENLRRQRGGATSDSLHGDWVPAQVAVLCPDGTTSLVINLDRSGAGEVIFRSPRLWVAAPTTDSGKPN